MRNLRTGVAATPQKATLRKNHLFTESSAESINGRVMMKCNSYQKQHFGRRKLRIVV